MHKNNIEAQCLVDGCGLYLIMCLICASPHVVSGPSWLTTRCRRNTHKLSYPVFCCCCCSVSFSVWGCRAKSHDSQGLVSTPSTSCRVLPHNRRSSCAREESVVFFILNKARGRLRIQGFRPDSAGERETDAKTFSLSSGFYFVKPAVVLLCVLVNIKTTPSCCCVFSQYVTLFADWEVSRRARWKAAHVLPQWVYRPMWRLCRI